MEFKKYTHEVDFYLKDKRIFLTESGKKKAAFRPKKITGSRLAAVLGEDEYSTPFQVWCDILGFVKRDMEDFFMNAGVVIEPKLLKFISKEFNKEFTSYDAQKINFDLYKDVNIFGGIPDGEEIVNGKVMSILEIKTTSMDKYQWKKSSNEFKLVKKDNKPNVTSLGGGLAKWFKNQQIIIPQSYKYQLALYLYLRNINTGYFCIAFLNTQDYFFPENFSPYKSNFQYESLETDENMPDELKTLFVKDRVIIFEKMKIDIKKFQEVIDYATSWYENHVKGGISPELTTEDAEWMRYGFPNL